MVFTIFSTTLVPLHHHHHRLAFPGDLCCCAILSVCLLVIVLRPLIVAVPLFPSLSPFVFGNLYAKGSKGRGRQQQQQQQPLQSGGFSFGCSLFSGCFELNTVRKFSSLSLSPVPGCPSCCLLDRYCSSSAAAVVPYFLEWPFSLCFFYLLIYYAVSDTCCRL